MARAFIGLGSNLGDGRANLREAWQRMGETAGVTLLTIASPYLTRPVPKPEWRAAGKLVGDQYFTNSVGIIECSLSPLDLLAVLQAIETDMGRDRSQTVDRPIDLDLLYYDDLLRDGGELILPHPGIQDRCFVLAPLTEVAPEHLHPGLGLTSRQMLAALPANRKDEIIQLPWNGQAAQPDRGVNL